MCLRSGTTTIRLYRNLLTYKDSGDVVLEDGRRRRRSQGGYTVTFFSHFGRGRRLVDALLPKDAMPVRERISELKKEAWWGVDV